MRARARLVVGGRGRPAACGGDRDGGPAEGVGGPPVEGDAEEGFDSRARDDQRGLREVGDERAGHRGGDVGRGQPVVATREGGRERVADEDVGEVVGHGFRY